MIRLASISPGRVLSDGLRSRQRQLSSSSAAQRFFSAAAKDEETPKGIPYSKLTVGVPKERFPLEKRVAATPEVRDRSIHHIIYHGVTFIQIDALIVSNHYLHPTVCLQTSQTRFQCTYRKGGG